MFSIHSGIQKMAFNLVYLLFMQARLLKKYGNTVAVA